MDPVAKFQQELFELKKYKSALENNENDDSFSSECPELEDLGSTVKVLAEEKARLEEELIKYKQNKQQNRQKKALLEDELNTLELDLETLNKEWISLKNKNDLLQSKILHGQKVKLSSVDEEVLRNTVNKVSIYQRLMRVKFSNHANEKTLEGYVFNQNNTYLNYFKVNNDDKVSDKLWKEVKKASSEDWSDLEKEVKLELSKHF